MDSYKKQMEIQSISSFLAQQFNRKKPQGAKKIFFTKVVTISLYKRSKPFYCSQEPLIEGPYVKYNSNCGFVNKDDYAASLNAFSHWTYQETDGYLMVVDLQGVQITNPAGPKFALTDPALHCKDLTRFSCTNLGKPGMHRFFRTHYCNTICKAMGLEPPSLSARGFIDMPRADQRHHCDTLTACMHVAPTHLCVSFFLRRDFARNVRPRIPRVGRTPTFLYLDSYCKLLRGVN